MDKRALLLAIIEKLDEERKDLAKSVERMRQAAIEAPGPMQSHSDTTKFQMGSLSDDAAGSLAEKEQAIFRLRNLLDHPQFMGQHRIVGGGSLVQLEEADGARGYYYFVPGGAGTEITHDAVKVTVVSLGAPLATALFKKGEGDLVELDLGQNSRELTILKVM